MIVHFDLKMKILKLGVEIYVFFVTWLLSHPVLNLNEPATAISCPSTNSSRESWQIKGEVPNQNQMHKDIGLIVKIGK